MSNNTASTVLGSTATGAATGASVGGPYGAVIGGIAGLGLGTLTAYENAESEKEKQKILEQAASDLNTSTASIKSAIENGGDVKTQTLDNLAIVLGVSVDFIMYGKNEENSELLSEAMDVLSDMDELQIRQCLAMMKAMKSVSVEK